LDVEVVRSFLAWCTVLNWIALLFWWAMLFLAGDWVYGMHSKWFKISRETFDAIHYGGLALFKATILLFNFVPYLVLRLFF
jgi:hypothetical protein